MKNNFKDWTASYYVSKGADRSKILIGIPGYGRCFNLKSPQTNGMGASVTGPCAAGTYTREAGILSYYEVSKRLEKHFMFLT